SGGDVPPVAAAAGFCIGGAWKPGPLVGIVADFSRHSVSDNHLSINTFLAGLRLYSGEHYHLSGFVTFFAGAERTALAGQPTDWNAVLGPGAGADLRLTDHLVWRGIQADATLSPRGGGFGGSSRFVFCFLPLKGKQSHF